eukprot:2150890-Rhodomonas_salina.1
MKRCEIAPLGGPTLAQRTPPAETEPRSERREAQGDGEEGGRESARNVAEEIRRASTAERTELDGGA